MEQKTVLDGKATLLIPTSFHIMTDEEYRLKYPNPRQQASIIYTDSSLQINVLLYLTELAVENKDIPEFTKMQKELMVKKRPDMEVIETKERIADGHTIGYFKFLSQALDTKIFNCMFFASVNDKLLIGTFNCMEKQRTAWENAADSIVSSLRFK